MHPTCDAQALRDMFGGAAVKLQAFLKAHLDDYRHDHHHNNLSMQSSTVLEAGNFLPNTMLLHGPSGFGKTQLVRMTCQALDCVMHTTAYVDLLTQGRHSLVMGWKLLLKSMHNKSEQTPQETPDKKSKDQSGAPRLMVLFLDDIESIFPNQMEDRDMVVKKKKKICSFLFFFFLLIDRFDFDSLEFVVIMQYYKKDYLQFVALFSKFLKQGRKILLVFFKMFFIHQIMLLLYLFFFV